MIKHWLVKLATMMRSSRGKDAMIFSAFLLLSYGFWIILSLNDDGQREVKVKLELTDIPPGTTFITDPPSDLKVSVRDKGTILAAFSWNGSPTLHIPYQALTSSPTADRLSMSGQELAGRVRSLFQATTQIVAIRPDSLSMVYTDRPGRRIKVTPDIDITPSAQSVICGPVTVTPDSVTVFSARHLPVMPKAVKTMKLTRTDLTDTLTVTVSLQPQAGVKTVPDKVTLTIPVEPLIAKKRTIPVNLLNSGSNDHNIVLFPSRVDVSYLVPMSQYSNESGVLTVNADFSHRSQSKIPLTLGSVPDYCQGVRMQADSVEYLIEQQTSLRNDD